MPLNSEQRLAVYETIRRIIRTMDQADEVEITLERPEVRVTQPRDTVEKYELGPIHQFTLEFRVPKKRRDPDLPERLSGGAEQ